MEFSKITCQRIAITRNLRGSMRKLVKPIITNIADIRDIIFTACYRDRELTSVCRNSITEIHKSEECRFQLQLQLKDYYEKPINARIKQLYSAREVVSYLARCICTYIHVIIKRNTASFMRCVFLFFNSREICVSALIDVTLIILSLPQFHA